MLIEKINELLVNKRCNEKQRDYIGASEIGHPCARKVWYSYNQKENKSISEKLLMTFEIGHYIESMVIDLIIGARITMMTNFNTKGITGTIKGHVDAFIVDDNGEAYVLEIKSACNTQFNIFKNKGVMGWKMQYYAQVQAYMGMNGVNKAILLAINKDTSEMHEEIIDFDAVYYNELNSRAEYIINAKEPPERINKNPCFFICKTCPFVRECHE